MPMPRSRRSRIGWFSLAACFLGWFPGCAGQRNDMTADQTWTAQRPVYPVDGTRPLFLGGYAGADYHPATRPSR